MIITLCYASKLYKQWEITPGSMFNFSAVKGATFMYFWYMHFQFGLTREYTVETHHE